MAAEVPGEPTPRRERFDTPGPITLGVDVAAGAVHVIAGVRADTVVVLRAADGADATAVDRVRVDFKRGRLMIRPATGRARRHRAGAVEVTVELPDGSDVRVDSADAAVRCEGRAHGDIDVRTVRGTIRIDEARCGRLHLVTAIGDIEVGLCRGSAALLDLRTVSGRLRNTVPVVTGPDRADEVVEVCARTVDGDIVIRRSPIPAHDTQSKERHHGSR